MGKEDRDFVRRLLDNGADMNVAVLGAKSQYGATPLHFASAGGQLEVMDELLESGTDIVAQTNGGVCGWTSLHCSWVEELYFITK